MSSHSGERPAFLILRLSSFGDVVLTEPVTRELKRAFPQCRVVFATCDRYAGIPRLFSCVDEVAAVSPGRAELRAKGGVAEVAFDAVIDLQNNFRSRSIARRARARRVIRYGRQYLRRFLCVYLPWIWKGNLRHTVELYLDTLRPLGLAAPLSAPRVSVSSGFASDLRKALGEGPLVGICPGTSSRHKTWGRARFALLAGKLRAQGRRVLVIGSEADRGEVEAVSVEARDPGVTTHITDDVATMAGLLSVCAVAVSNDSGLMHLAAAVGCKVVGIFGPTSPSLGFAPLASGARAVTRNAPCSPCSYHGNRPCRYETQSCMEEIDPSEVASIVNDLAGKSGRA